MGIRPVWKFTSVIIRSGNTKMRELETDFADLTSA